MLTNSNYTYSGEHLGKYIIAKSLCCMPETILMVFRCIPIKNWMMKKMGKRSLKSSALTPRD